MHCQWGRELRPPRSAVGFAKENIDLSEHLKRPNKQRRQIIPWGWNHSLKKRLINEGIDFIGYSLFESKNGAYSKNILASNEEIEDMIAEYIPRDTLISIREDLTAILADTLVGHYEGFLGVDQIICQTDSPAFIPVSEINLRMTMGLIARNQFDNFC